MANDSNTVMYQFVGSSNMRGQNSLNALMHPGYARTVCATYPVCMQMPFSVITYLLYVILNMKFMITVTFVRKRRVHIVYKNNVSETFIHSSLQRQRDCFSGVIQDTCNYTATAVSNVMKMFLYDVMFTHDELCSVDESSGTSEPPGE